MRSVQNLLYRVSPKDPKQIPQLNESAKKLTKYVTFGPLCSKEFVELPIDFENDIDEFKCDTFTCLELNNRIDNYALRLGEIREPKKMLDLAACVAAYALGLRRLAAESAICDTELVITFKFRK